MTKPRSELVLRVSSWFVDLDWTVCDSLCRESRGKEKEFLLRNSYPASSVVVSLFLL
jgi:hypothetical protein